MNADVKKIINKKNIAIVSIIILILMNMFQYNKISDYKAKTRSCRYEFWSSIRINMFWS